MVRIWILQLGSTFEDFIPTHGDFDDWFVARLRGVASSIEIFRLHLGEPLPSTWEADGIVLTGSHDMVTDRAAWSERTGRWLGGAIERGMPILGICYGHQILADVLGGQIGYLPGGPEFGTVECVLTDDAADDPLLIEQPRAFPVQTSHSQAVLALPPGAVRLARTDRDPNHAFRYGQSVWGLQFHPEFDARTTAEYIRRCGDQLHEPGQLLRDLRETPESEGLLRQFATLFA